MDKQEAVRRIPSIDALLESAASKEEFTALSHVALVSILRQAVQTVRQDIISGDAAWNDEPAFLRDYIFRIAIGEKNRLLQPSLKRVVNATGIILHTNLGRAPLGERARQEVNRAMEGYSNLEYDLEKGERGERQIHIAARIAAATGAEDALAVNNNAAAILLSLAGFARGREVIVSRGELVEIGGSFRIPEIMTQSGAIMVEVGTTNITCIEDYNEAITPNTAAILKVHTSNFRIVGFTRETQPAELCDLAHRRGLLAMNDLGSGTLLPFSSHGYNEPSVAESISSGFDIVTFSGDKLLGAGQAGIIAGRRNLLAALKREPLMRALRLDKLSIAALEGTLIDYAAGRSNHTLPVWEMLMVSRDRLKLKAEKLNEALAAKLENDWHVRVVETKSLAGGGALPAVEMAGFGVEVAPNGVSAGQLEEEMRRLPTPVIGLVRDGAIVLDVRCLRPDEDEMVCCGLATIQRRLRR